MQLEDNDTLEEGFYSLNHTNNFKGGILNISGTILMQVCYEEISLFIPVEENMTVGELQILIAKHIDLQPNKFIMTGISKKDDIFLISVDDYVIKLIKRGVEYLQVHDHNYDIDFVFYKKLSITMKKSHFYNQKFEFQFYVHDQMTINLLKQLIFERIHKLYDINIGIEFETAEGFLYDTRIAATLRKNEIIGVDTFEIKMINYILEFDGGEVDIECNNNLTICEFEHQVRKTFFLGKNIKLFSNLKNPNMNMHINI
jgi:hypothetical protein